MRTTIRLLAVYAGLAGLSLGPAHAQNLPQSLQNLLSGNQGQDQAVREAFERGYRQGREDQGREDRARFERRGPPPPPPPPRGQYPDQDFNQGQRNPYGR